MDTEIKIIVWKYTGIKVKVNLILTFIVPILEYPPLIFLIAYLLRTHEHSVVVVSSKSSKQSPFLPWMLSRNLLGD